MYNGWGPYSPYSPYMAALPHAPGSQPVPTPTMGNRHILIPPTLSAIRTVPLPPTPLSGAQLNPRLAYMTSPHIEYDVRRHPAYALVPNSGPEWGSEPAINTWTNEMIVICMVLPKPFTVRLSSKDYNFVTVMDVLVATHQAFCEAARGDIAADVWVPGFSSRFGAPIGRYKWAGLSEQRDAGSWLLHIE